MSATLRAPETAPHGSIHRFDVEQYRAMIDSGILGEDDRVELLDGVIVEIMTKSSPHNFAVSALADLLRDTLGELWIVLEEKPLELGPNSLPEPDIAVVAGPRDRYKSQDPSAEFCGMVVEVAGSTYKTDRDQKLGLYAAANIPLYWIVDLNESRVEVHSKPEPQGEASVYRETKLYSKTDAIPVEIAGETAAMIAADRFFP